MFQLIQPAATLFVGFAMFTYGLIQAILHRPATSTFSTAIAALPDAAAVLIFLLGICAIITGIILLTTGIRGVKNRTREINRVFGHRPQGHTHPHDEYEDNWDTHPAYR